MSDLWPSAEKSAEVLMLCGRNYDEQKKNSLSITAKYMHFLNMHNGNDFLRK